MVQYCFSHSRGFTRLAISENGRPRDVAHDEQNGCYGALSLESSKSDAIKILLVETTRPIHIYHLPSRRRRPMCPGNRAQNAAIPDEHKIEWVARACPQLSQMIAAAKWIAARKFRAV